MRHYWITATTPIDGQYTDIVYRVRGRREQRHILRDWPQARLATSSQRRRAHHALHADKVDVSIWYAGGIGAWYADPSLHQERAAQGASDRIPIVLAHRVSPKLLRFLGALAWGEDALLADELQRQGIIGEDGVVIEQDMI